MTLKAFISSTSQDLGDYRQAAFEVCNRLQIVPIGMELFEAMGMGATAASLHKLADADVYVGILANRYGYIEAGHERSVTELEFDGALARGMAPLCFLSDPAAPLPVFSDNAAKLAAFRARVEAQVVRSTFASPWEFRYKLQNSLQKWLYDQRGESPLLRDVFRPLFAHHDRFVGRETELQQVQQFIDGPAAGFLVITAPAGYGKTALATRIVERHRATTAYHFFTTLYQASGGAESDILSERFFLQNVTEQLRQFDVAPHDDRPLPATLSAWVSAWQRAFGTALKEPRLLLIDGLDEVRSWSLRPYLMAPPGAGLKVIVTLRDVGQDWRGEYGSPAGFTQHLALGGLRRDEVRAALRLAGPMAARIGDSDPLLDRVLTVTTPDGRADGADPLYIAYLADALQSGDVTEATLGTQPTRLEDDLDRWWAALVQDADAAAVDLLATLAVVLGPIGADDLRLLHPSLRRSLVADPLDVAVRRLRRAVAGDARAGYGFAHPRMRDHVRRNPAIAPAEAALLAHARDWAAHRGRYALTHLVRHLLQGGDDAALFTTVLDPAFQQAQRQVLGSAQRTLADLALAVQRAADAGRMPDLLRCAAAYRRVAGAEGLSRQVFDALHARRYAVLAEQLRDFALDVKASGSWLMALRCHLIRCAAEAGDADAALALAGQFAHRLGLGHLGAVHPAAALCDALIAGAVVRLPALAGAIGVDAALLQQACPPLQPHPADDPALPALLAEVETRIANLEWTLGEQQVSAVEFIDEERAGEYTMRLRDALVAVAGSAAGPALLDRAAAALLRNPYPRYRDNGLVALALAALAFPDWTASMRRLEAILETGLEREGVTFTCELAAQLVAEAGRRGLDAGALADVLQHTAATHDRWGSALRCAGARAAALGSQGRAADADALLLQALTSDDGFAGYACLHVLALAARWCALGRPQQVAALDLPGRARGHAGRVRDPRFADERRDLVDHWQAWLAAPAPAWPELAALLRTMPDPDARRTCKDLASARWLAAAPAGIDWGALVVASLNDATALDTVLGRLFGRLFAQQHGGAAAQTSPALSDVDLVAAMAVAAADIATARPWSLEEPAYA